MTVFITSDSHIAHGNILAYCPWRQSWAKNISDMDAKLIDAWNSVVGPDDEVYHLGDLAFGSEAKLTELRFRLNGVVHLAVGNHDRTATSLRRCGYDAAKVFTIETPDGQLVLRHRPQDFRVEEITAAYALLHGHLHGQAHYGDRPQSEVAKLMDVGIDATRSIVPLPLTQILALYRDRKNG